MFELSNELALSFEKIGLYFFIFIITIQTLFIFWSLITSFDFCKKYWKETIAFGLKTLLVEKSKKNKFIAVASQNQKILIIDNNMENLFALKKESFIVEEVKIIKKYKYTPKTKEELKALIKNESIHLGDIDTKYITDMSYLFAGSTRKDFSGIEKWNTFFVKNMNYMFYRCENFNYDILPWDTSNVKTMEGMFRYCENFNQDISKWNTMNVRNMNGMFWDCKNFNQDISDWNVKNVEKMTKMLKGCKSFNQDLSSWDVRNVEHRYGMFYESGMEWDDSKKPRFVKE
ncbi:BspA family leucine-rich repeat surface protein [Campylobacter coli]|nr:BspA family leucine-rich repeat surface protein [Campylobacter coli]